MAFLNKQKGHTLEIERKKSDEKVCFDLKRVFFFQFFLPPFFKIIIREPRESKRLQKTINGNIR
jgi:hypothetical protein